MRAKAPVFLILGVLVLAAIAVLHVLGQPSTAAPIAERGLEAGNPASGTPAPDGEVVHTDLGGGRYVAIIPAAADPEDTNAFNSYIDTYVDSYNSGTSYCTVPSLQLEYGFAPGRVHALQEYYKRTLIGFHLSSIPTVATVTSAVLYLYQYSSGGKSSANIAAYRVTSNWGCPVTWPGPSSLYYAGKGVSSSSGWKTWTITNMVNGYWKGKNFGVSPNRGLQLRGLETGGSGNYYWRYYRSKNYGGTDHDPYLRVVYEMPTATPTRTPTATPTRTPVVPRTKTPTPTSTAPGCPDDYEPNDTFATAWRLQHGGKLHSYICDAGDQDWFSIELVLGQSLHLTLTNQPADYHLELFNPLGRLVARPTHKPAVAATAQDVDEIHYVASEVAGLYRVRVRGIGGASDPANRYRLILDQGELPLPTPTSPPTPTSSPTPTCAPDAYEPNDNTDDAAPIGTGMEIRAYICPNWDWDYYRFTVPPASEIHAQLHDLPQDYQLALIDPSRHIIARAGGPDTNPRELIHAAAAGGDYYVRIIPGSVGDPVNPYTLRVDLADLSPTTLLAVEDSYVEELNPTANHGEERLIQVSQDEFLYKSRGLFRFDLSEIPAGTIHSAVFKAYLQADSRAGTVHLRRVISPWDEDAVTWNTIPASMDMGVSATVGPVSGLYYTWDVTALVQGWLTEGMVNYGMLLMSSSPFTFRSKEYGAGMFFVGTGGAHTPRLVINFVEAAGGADGSISGTVYDDLDRNARRDPGEPGVDGVRVQLFRHSAYDGAQSTSSGGDYSFVGLAADDYDVTVDYATFPGDHVLTTAESQYVILAAGESRYEVDFGISALPTPTPLPDSSIDLRAEGMEFIQVVDEVPMIQGKRTLARLYVRVLGTTDPVPDISGRLFLGSDSILPLTRATLLPSADPMNDDAIVSNLDHTLNFLLPPAWTLSNHTFRGFVNYDESWRECDGCFNSLNQFTDFVQFRSAHTLEVVLVDVTANGIAPPVYSPDDVVEYLRVTYPVNTVNVTSDSLSVSDIDFTDRTTGGCGSGWGDLLDEIEDMDIFSDLVDDESSTHTHLYGVLDDSVPHGFSGCGRTPGNAAARLVDPASLAGPQRTVAHEIGHNLGRRHTACNGREGNPDLSYPYPGGSIGVYGIDLTNPASPVYLDPATHNDIMSYCGSRWLSDWTFDHLRNQLSLSVAGEARGAPTLPRRQYLVGTGYVKDGLVTQTRPFYRLMLPTGTSDGPGSGPYVLELQDAGGAPLFSRHFDTIGDSVLPVEGVGYFRQTVPWQQGTARIVLKEGQTVLLVTPVSANPPEVSLVSPNGGEVWAAYGEAEITWEGSDLDGDPLRFALQHSADGGTNWKAVAANLTGASYVVDLARLAGGETALMRIIASDGVNTTYDQSKGTFRVGSKPPQPYIIWPEDGSTMLPGRPMLLEGGATDVEDGAITDDAVFTWTSDREGSLGAGRTVYLDDLRRGRHVITLRVVDGGGFTEEVTISIHVGAGPWLPLITRDH